ncbi:sperm-associated antigen 4 protein-like [Coturnix japonica]|uniref:SUN domain-containing protein 3-like n=1 Tax=Coturnix japonica TaxID=93934 RepID=A0A8C2T5E9_COTJA|nr:sperm-associated antigen 4 protein-like [Coturnix japonica]
MRRRKTPRRPEGTQRAHGRVRVRRAGRNLEEAEMESNRFPENRCTHSAVARAGPASFRSSASCNEVSVIIRYLRESPTMVSLRRLFQRAISVKEIAKRSSWICLVLFLIFVSSLTGSYTGVLFARRFWITDFMQMLSLQTVPCIMNSGNLLTDQTQGIENQKKGVPYLTEDHGTVMKVIQYLRGAVSVKPRENCFAKSDWVWKSAGVSIDLQRSSGPAWHCRVAWFLCSPNMLETFEQVDISPGFCWPLKASLNSVVFNLPSKVLPTAVTVQHDTDITLWDISSAPRNFVVFGLDKEGENVAILGKFTYDISKELTQTFELQTGTPRAFWYIKFVVLSNWGSAGQTCIYRVQVHGKTVGTNDIS